VFVLEPKAKLAEYRLPNWNHGDVGMATTVWKEPGSSCHSAWMHKLQRINAHPNTRIVSAKSVEQRAEEREAWKEWTEAKDKTLPKPAYQRRDRPTNYYENWMVEQLIRARETYAAEFNDVERAINEVHWSPVFALHGFHTYEQAVRFEKHLKSKSVHHESVQFNQPISDDGTKNKHIKYCGRYRKYQKRERDPHTAYARYKSVEHITLWSDNRNKCLAPGIRRIIQTIFCPEPWDELPHRVQLVGVWYQPEFAPSGEVPYPANYTFYTHTDPNASDHKIDLELAKLNELKPIRQSQWQQREWTRRKRKRMEIESRNAAADNNGDDDDEANNHNTSGNHRRPNDFDNEDSEGSD
jgi:hypothetical protein